MNKIFFKTTTILLVFTATFSSAESEPLIFSTTVTESTLSFRMSEALLNHISRQIQIPIKLTYLPAKRASYMFSLGKIDAEFSRVSQYQAIQPHAIKTEEPISTLPVYVFSVGKNFTVDGWQSLMPYRMLTVSGWLYTKQHLLSHNTVEVDSPLQALKMLKAGRADLFTADLLSVKNTLNALEFDKDDFLRLEPPVAKKSTYTFFLPEHSSIAKAYNKALIELKSDGTYQKILREVR